MSPKAIGVTQRDNPGLPGAIASRRWVKEFGLALALASFVFVWMHVGAHLIYKTNDDRTKSDQQAAIDLARESRSDLVPHRTNAVSNNLFAWTAAKLVWDDDEQTFFVRGKWMNLIVSGLVAIGGTIAIASHWGALPALVVAVLGGLGAVLPRAVYFQPETFYLIAFTGSCIAGFGLLRRNPLWLYPVFGILSGLAFLAKPSNVPFMLVWIVASAFRCVFALLPERYRFVRAEWKFKRHIIGCLVAAGSMLFVIAPLGIWSAQQYGKPYFNMTKYWMWQDDYGTESVPLLVNYGDARRMNTLSPEEVPSAARYFRTHSGGEAFARLADGTWGKLQRFVFPEKRWVKIKKDAPHRRLLNFRGIYLGVLGAVALVACIASVIVIGTRRRDTGASSQRPALAWLWRPEAAETLLVFGAFSLYALAYGWYEPIGRGDRFMMTLYLPLVLWLVWVIIENVRGMGSRVATTLSVILFAGVLAFQARDIRRLIVHPVFSADESL